jgi:hypothetical protein
MPKPILKKASRLLLATVCLAAVIINSCKKDSRNDQQNSVTDQAIAQAKTWYESTYPVSSTKVTTQANGTNTDLSQIIKPDWQHNASYTRFNKKVIELPLDPSSKFNPAIKNMTTGRSSNSTYSRSSFILINNGSGYDAYVMTLIADSAYLKNDLSKLDRNKYNKRDADYSGLVLYFTPKGKYIGGWRYKDGHIVVPGSQNNSSGVKVQSLGTSKLKPMSEDCYDYWLTNYSDVYIYLFTLCSSGDGGTSYGSGPGSIGGNGGDGGGGGSGSGPGDGGPSSTTPPPPCNSAVHPGPVPIINSSGKLTVNDVPPDGGDGFPPPQGPCYIETLTELPTIKTDSLAKHYPCAVKLIINNLGECGVYTNLVAAFTKTSKPDLTWQDGTLPWSTSSSGTFELGHTGTDPTSGIGQSSIITLNSNMLKNSTRLLIAAAAIHETLHAYINYSVNTGVDGITHGYSTGDSWFYGIDTWIALNGLPPNYSNHLDMIADYFDKAVTALKTWDNGAHTDKEYQMATLFGLDNGRDGTSAQQAQLQTEFNSLLTKYNITSTDLNTFNIKNLNATTDKLPTSGCN